MRLLVVAMFVVLVAGCCCPEMAKVSKEECERRCASNLSTCQDICGPASNPVGKGCREGCAQSAYDCRAKCK